MGAGNIEKDIDFNVKKGGDVCLTCGPRARSAVTGGGGEAVRTRHGRTSELDQVGGVLVMAESWVRRGSGRTGGKHERQDAQEERTRVDRGAQARMLTHAQAWFEGEYRRGSKGKHGKGYLMTTNSVGHRVVRERHDPGRNGGEFCLAARRVGRVSFGQRERAS